MSLPVTSAFYLLGTMHIFIYVVATSAFDAYEPACDFSEVVV